MKMHKKQGFTLVELLVVMAIIAILASIALPQVTKYLRNARATKALTEINGIEMALTTMLTDSNRSSLHHLFKAGDPNNSDSQGVFWHLYNQGGFEDPNQYCGAWILTANGFKAAQKLYTRTLYALMREGRTVLHQDEYDNDLGTSYRAVLNSDVVKRLGTSYNTDLAFDPFGGDNLYQIYPGPWPAKRIGLCNAIIPNDSLNVFRIYLVSEAANDLPGTRGGARSDNKSVNVIDPATENTERVGYAAPRDRIAFIYSMGENLLSSQSLYRGSTLYDPNQEEEFKGGGDDINNWDTGRSWMRFYN
jgi:prepilin-type N-terminal cleavage/methylation domain-containing protein